eukprot:TRINITY_DN10427_c0_g1_i6.p2 TRINITY_DN10427_c0_g1~~TRINITY_DN10427_c0_g1_i6.p2  ORF type:complete len:108 (+),score=11.36 TRINITY_DN10427_c0_g1_i6:215-538(+)
MQVYSLEDVISLPSFRRACKGKLVLTTEQIQVNAPEDVISLTSCRKAIHSQLSDGDPFSVQRQTCVDDRADVGERAKGRDQLDELSEGVRSPVRTQTCAPSRCRCTR